MSRRSWAVARLAVPLALTLTLVACSSDEDPPETDPSPNAASSSSVTDPGVVTENNGTTVTAYQGVPPDYPSDQVPLLDEDEVDSSSVTEYRNRTAYSVIVVSDLPVGEAQIAATDLLTETDLEQTGPPPAGDSEPVTYTGDNGDLFVILIADPIGTGSELTYTVEVK